MAKLSELALRTSEITGVPVPTVREISRRLREAGLIHTGKGGRYGGAEMTATDAARLLIAVMITKASSAALTGIVPLTRNYLTDLTAHSALGKNLVPSRWGRKLALAELCRLKIGHTFEDAIVGLIASMSNLNFETILPKWGSCTVHIEVSDPVPDPRALVRVDTTNFGTFTLYFFPRRLAQTLQSEPSKNWSDIRTDSRFDLRARASITASTLKYIGLALRKYEHLDA